MNTVFILGAGASADAGAPVMKNFLEKARYLNDSKLLDNEEKQSFQNVFRAIDVLNRVHTNSKLNTNNIEVVFSAIEMAKTLECFSENAEIDVNKVFDDLKVVISSTLEKRISYRIDNFGGRTLKTANGYNEFAQMLFETTTTSHNSAPVIITFNYDVALEVTLFSHDFWIDYGLQGVTEEIDPKAQYNRIPITVLKLHGSLNWFSDGPDGVSTVRVSQIRDNLENYKEGSREFLRSNIHGIKKSMANATTQSTIAPLIVPPTWNKGAYYEPIASVWKQAATALRWADHIVIIGYSKPPTDVFFEYLFALGTLGGKVLQKFIVVDKEESTIKRYKEFVGTNLTDVFVDVPIIFQKAAKENLPKLLCG